MYDRSETAAANDQFWTEIRRALGYGPEQLNRSADLWDIWQDPELVLSQTCGYPYRAKLHGRVTLVGTLDYGIKDCPAGYYNSVFVSRRDDPRHDLADFSTAKFAYNEPMSQSGWAAPMAQMAEQGLTFGRYIQSGGHLKSAKMVADSVADIAAIDAVTWAMIEKYDSFSKTLHIISRTAPTPGLPYITAAGRDKSKLFAAIQTGISNLPPAAREVLQIKGLVDIPVEKYLEIATPAAP